MGVARSAMGRAAAIAIGIGAVAMAIKFQTITTKLVKSANETHRRRIALKRITAARTEQEQIAALIAARKAGCSWTAMATAHHGRRR